MIIEELSDIFELATSATKFVKDIVELKKNNKKQDEDSAKIGSSGDYAQIGSSGDSAKIGSSGYYAKIGSSGYSAKIGSSGYSAQIGSSGDYAQIGSSGDSAQIGSSGDYAQIGSSGDSAKIGSSGMQSVISAIGHQSTIKAKKGSWATLAEYDIDGKVLFVKTEYVDGERIKEDTEYCLYGKEFKKVIVADGIRSAIVHKRGNIYRVKNFNDNVESYLIEQDGLFAHGKTIKQARMDLLFKLSSDDLSEYQNIKADEIRPLEFWVVAYRKITRACQLGTQSFLDEVSPKSKLTLNDVIKLTNGRYGHSTFVEFFKNNQKVLEV